MTASSMAAEFVCSVLEAYGAIAVKEYEGELFPTGETGSFPGVVSVKRTVFSDLADPTSGDTAVSVTVSVKLLSLPKGFYGAEQLNTAAEEIAADIFRSSPYRILSLECGQLSRQNQYGRLAREITAVFSYIFSDEEESGQ